MKKINFYKNRSQNKAKSSICRSKLNRFKNHSLGISFWRNKEINKLFDPQINKLFSQQEC